MSHKNSFNEDLRRASNGSPNSLRSFAMHLELEAADKARKNTRKPVVIPKKNSSNTEGDSEAAWLYAIFLLLIIVGSLLSV